MFSLTENASFQSPLLRPLWSNSQKPTIDSWMVFVDDLFGQHLVHKSVLTILAWCLYAILLAQYFRRGWRVQSAITVNLIAFGLLVLGFFGSKLVLELLLPVAQ